MGLQRVPAEPTQVWLRRPGNYGGKGRYRKTDRKMQGEKGGLRREPAEPTQELAIAYHQQWETSGGSSSGTGRNDL